jgi:hypothetical protein
MALRAPPHAGVSLHGRTAAGVRRLGIGPDSAGQPHASRWTCGGASRATVVEIDEVRSHLHRWSSEGSLARLAVGLSVVASGCIGGMGTRMGDAEVKLVDSQPCIGVTTEEIERLGSLGLYALVVSDTSIAAPRRIWSAVSKDLDAPMVTLTAGRCLHYGEVPPGYEGVPPVPPKLEQDRVYEAAVNARPVERRRDGTQGYTVRFCLPSASPGRVLLLSPTAARCTSS